MRVEVGAVEDAKGGRLGVVEDAKGEQGSRDAGGRTEKQRVA